MPPGRPRKVSGQNARAQGTLAFGPNKNKITKPSPLSQSHKKISKPEKQHIEEAVAESPAPSPEEEEAKTEPKVETPTLAIRSQQPEKSVEEI